MKITPTELPSVLEIELQVFADDRGYFVEPWNRQRYEQAGVPGEMRQDSLSYSKQGVIRGLHYQFPHSQGKLITVLEGEIFDVAADVRTGSPTFGRWVARNLSAENRRQLFIPAGFAHGFCVLSAGALVAYKCTEAYRCECDRAIAWNDPQIGVVWPVSAPVLSVRDRSAPRLAQLAPDQLPAYSGD